MTNPTVPTPLSDAAICNQWPTFTEEVFRFLPDLAIKRYPDLRARAHERLLRGKVEYGDSSFAAQEDTLLDEIAQEFLDAYNWAFIAWCQTDESIYLTIAAHAAQGFGKVVATAEYRAAREYQQPQTGGNNA